MNVKIYYVKEKYGKYGKIFCECSSLKSIKCLKNGAQIIFKVWKINFSGCYSLTSLECKKLEYNKCN